jgi:hypothetical protein
VSTELAWFKSSYSSSGGGECLEVAYALRESSGSGGLRGSCVEGTADAVHVRDSKFGARSPRFAVPASAWTAFVAYVSRGT